MDDRIAVGRDGSVATVTLNRPEAFNAFDLEMLGEMAETFIGLAADASVRAVVLAGRGRAFCAGGDLKWALGWPDGPDAAFHRLAGRFHDSIREIRRMPKPVIAALGGVAAGGGFTLALACDFRVMDPGAMMHQSFTSYGLSIDGSGTFSLPRLVGLARALEIAAFDEPISAKQALDWGLVTKLSPEGQALEESLALAQRLAERSVHSFSLAKKLMIDSFSTDLETQMERERAALVACGGHPDGVEGLEAFVHKRKPNYVA